MTAPHVLVVAWDWPAYAGGGAAALTRTLCLGLAALGARVTVLARGGGRRAGALTSARPDPSVAVRAVPGRSWRTFPRAHWRAGVARAVAVDPPDGVVVASLDALPGTLAGLRGGGSSAPVLTLAHGRDVTGVRRGRHEALRVEALAAPVRWAGLSPWMAAELRRRGIPRARVLPAAVPAPPGPAGRRGRRLLALGRLVPRKGHDVLIAAMASLPGVALDVVGDGPCAPSLRARAAPLGERIRFWGPLPAVDLEARWADAAALVLPTREERGGDTEGFGLVFLEAGARGRPVVAGATAGVTAAVEHGANGLLVPDPRDPVAVAAAVRALLDDPARADALGAEGRARWAASGRPEHLAAAALDALELPAVGRP